jgi:hypothetical protein
MHLKEETAEFMANDIAAWHHLQELGAGSKVL